MSTPLEEDRTNTTKRLGVKETGEREAKVMQKLWQVCFEKKLVDAPGPPKSREEKLQQDKKQKDLRQEKEALGMV
ncbi:hypothetical protein AC579_9995 [Pseudocercospora musae]|uniref:Uncharacterized protein n=1 Tax=Pseudocercospora musae TaxID=113226 RepID=A0A139I5C5_9PEZI|nr:hypothetical protein AC579_9995 [Pseudocercospora musae]